jgi:hypothetical protein
MQDSLKTLFTLSELQSVKNLIIKLKPIMKILKTSLLLLSMLFSTVACSSNDDDTDNTGDTEGGEEVVLATDAPFYPINFETVGFGAEWTWSVFENGNNLPLEFIANPDKNGINTSSTVAKITALQAGAPYVGLETKHGEDIGGFKFDETNSIVRIMVYKTVISDVGLKFAEFALPGQGAEAQAEIKVANTKINEWEELTFDLSGSIGKGVTMIVDQLIIFPDFNARSSDNVIYFDNITFSAE